jgi:hypothetical protein
MLPEVMDKEPSLALIWLVYLAIGTAGYRAVKARSWLLVPVLFLITGATWSLFHDLADRYVGPAIIAEAGWGYLIVSGLAALVAVALTAAGYRSRKRAA